MENYSRHLGRDSKNRLERVYTRSLKVWKDKFVPSSNLPNKIRFKPYLELGRRLSPSRYDSLSMFNRKVDISRLWNKARYSFYCKIIQLPEVWSLSKIPLYCKISFPIPQKNKYHRNYIGKGLGKLSKKI